MPRNNSRGGNSFWDSSVTPAPFIKGQQQRRQSRQQPAQAQPATPRPEPTTNQRIRQQLRSAGHTVNYREAAATAQQLGVSVDRVYNQTERTGQGAIIGRHAFEAGYLPGRNSRVNPTRTIGYYEAGLNAQNAQPESETASASPDGGPPQFDWDAWQQQMLAQQAAVWESMDAMNAEFMRSQRDWIAQQAQTQGRARTAAPAAGSADGATVRRRRRRRSNSGVRTSPGTSTRTAGGAAGSGLSLGGGGGSGSGLSIGR